MKGILLCQTAADLAGHHQRHHLAMHHHQTDRQTDNTVKKKPSIDFAIGKGLKTSDITPDKQKQQNFIEKSKQNFIEKNKQNFIEKNKHHINDVQIVLQLFEQKMKNIILQAWDTHGAQQAVQAWEKQEKES